MSLLLCRVAVSQALFDKRPSFKAFLPEFITVGDRMVTIHMREKRCSLYMNVSHSAHFRQHQPGENVTQYQHPHQP